VIVDLEDGRRRALDVLSPAVLPLGSTRVQLGEVDWAPSGASLSYVLGVYGRSCYDIYRDGDYHA